MLTRAQIRHDDGKSKRERDQSQNEFGEDLRLRSQKQAQSKGGMSQSQTQSQLRMDDIKVSCLLPSFFGKKYKKALLKPYVFVALRLSKKLN